MTTPRPIRVLLIFGTRPEAIKLCPVVRYLQNRPEEFEPRVCATAQHRDMLDQVLDAFGVRPDHDLNLMTPGQTLFQSTSRILAGLEPVFEAEQPDVVLVQGDTTTTLCGALAGFYRGVPVGHVEAGLRTGDMYQPFPEEANRVLTGHLAALHFASTDWAADNLRREGIPDARIFVTGNTGIDAVLRVSESFDDGTLVGPDWPLLDSDRRLILVTAHRRESFGEGMANICEALRTLAARPEVQIVFPVHPNPNVRGPVHQALGGLSNVILTDPIGYVPFVDLMRRASILVTDSGGIQEEGPSLGKPVLVLRDKTERPEAVEAGTVRLVGTNPEKIVHDVISLLEDDAAYERMARVHNPYGDGRASARIADLILSFQRKNKF